MKEHRKDITWAMAPRFVTGAILSNCFILLLYSMGRFTTRSLLLLGKQSNIEILTSRLFITAITFAVLAIMFVFPLIAAFKRAETEKSKNWLTSVFVAVGVTECLYLIFKQVFWVSLARGVIFW
ncbi:MAG: hypothetical protein JRH18_17005 [Deltaproteobacteria bacterium]|nr:hypothetical protein [Deltaproteobacteria bacterium]